MQLNRRNILAASAAGFGLVAAGGIWRVMRTPETATDPWAALSTPEPDLRLDAFRHAILAPNPHNRQPWLIRLDGTNGATIFCDLDRRLPMTDPFDRQITIGFGAFLEQARIAAAQRGVALQVTPFPDGEPGPRLDSRPIARLGFRAGSGADPLFAAIPTRRSNKDAYEPRPVSADTLARLVAAASVPAGHSSDPALIDPVRTQVLKAVAIETALPRTHRESVDVMRIGAREIDTQPDGIDLQGPMMEGLSAVGAISREALADPASSAFASGARMMAETYGAIPALLWVTTPGNTRLDQLEAGRRYVRLNLAATAAGLAMHPMSQSLQEYPEMAAPFAAVHQLLASGGGRVQMLARVGYAPAVPPSPRWPLSAKLQG
jgi:nitroreductase